MKAEMELPFKAGDKKIIVKITPQFLIFHKKRKQERVYVPWEKVIPFGTVVYTGEDR